MNDVGMNEADRGEDGIGWRRLDRGLWVARRDDRSVGTIEHLGYYVWIDGDGRPHDGRRTLREAQDDATAEIPIQPPADRVRAHRERLRLATTVSGWALLAVLVMAMWFIGWQLLQA